MMPVTARTVLIIVVVDVVDWENHGDTDKFLLVCRRTFHSYVSMVIFPCYSLKKINYLLKIVKLGEYIQ
jgi:hypothetical protein